MSAVFLNSGSGTNTQFVSRSGLFASFISNPSNIPSIITGNLVLYLDPSSYPGSGTTYTDLSGAGHNFTKSSGNYITSPIKCFQNGIFGTTTGNFLGDDMTIQTWINTTSVGSGNEHWRQMQVMSAEVPGAGNDFGFGLNQSGRIQWGNGPSDGTIASPAVVNTGAWLNVAVTRKKSTGGVKLYVNGVNVASATKDSGNTLNAQSNLLIGAGTDGGKNWNGYMGIFLTYSVVLSDADVLNNFNATRATYRI